MQQVCSTCENAQLDGATCIQRLLSKEKDPPIQAVAAIPGLIDRFVHLLGNYNAPKLQFECCWVLTNVRIARTSWNLRCMCVFTHAKVSQAHSQALLMAESRNQMLVCHIGIDKCIHGAHAGGIRHFYAHKYGSGRWRNRSPRAAARVNEYRS